MGTVIPYNIEDWFLMRCMKDNSDYYKDTDPKRFELAIKKTERIYRKALSEYVERGVAA
jgi:hypothetical protein